MHDFSSDYFKIDQVRTKVCGSIGRSDYSLAQWCLDRCYRHCFIDVSWNHYANGGTNIKVIEETITGILDRTDIFIFQ